MDDLGAGCLLVAVPGVLEDPNFRRTVVLVLEHGEAGALGLVLNRPSATRVDDPFPGWDGASSAPAVLFVGGPVQQSMIVALGERPSAVDLVGFQEVLTTPAGTIGTVDLRQEPWELGPSLTQLRVFAGYAGWSAGQLEAEIGQGAWWVLGAEPGDAFASDPDGLWRAVLARQPDERRLFARYPQDPSWN